MEQSRQMAGQVKQALGKVTRQRGLTQVTAPWNNKDSTCIRHMIKDKIKQACLAEAHQRFTQARTTPMLQQPMLGIFGIDNIDTPKFEAILDGMY